MPRWTVSIGNEGDGVVIERTGDGLVIIDIPMHRPARATRAEIEDLRRKFGAAIADLPLTSHPRDDPNRYPFVVTVTNAFEGTRSLAYGAEDGHVICSAPNWWRGDGTRMQEEAIGLAWAAAVRLARKQRGE